MQLNSNTQSNHIHYKKYKFIAERAQKWSLFYLHHLRCANKGENGLSSFSLSISVANICPALIHRGHIISIRERYVSSYSLIEIDFWICSRWFYVSFNWVCFAACLCCWISRFDKDPSRVLCTWFYPEGSILFRCADFHVFPTTKSILSTIWMTIDQMFVIVRINKFNFQQFLEINLYYNMPQFLYELIFYFYFSLLIILL